MADCCHQHMFNWQRLIYFDLQLTACIANVFGHASPGSENLVLSHSETALLIARGKLLLFWTDTCPKKFAIYSVDKYMLQECNWIFMGKEGRQMQFVLSRK